MAITFNYVPVSEEQQAVMQVYRDLFATLYSKIELEVEPGRGRALALTKLEEASMWLNKGLTNNDK